MSNEERVQEIIDSEQIDPTAVDEIMCLFYLPTLKRLANEDGDGLASEAVEQAYYTLLSQAGHTDLMNDIQGAPSARLDRPFDLQRYRNFEKWVRKEFLKDLRAEAKRNAPISYDEEFHGGARQLHEKSAKDDSISVSRMPQIKQDLESALSTLTSRQKRCVEVRYGLRGKKQQEVPWIAKKHGVCEEAIRATLRRALQRLIKAMPEWREYLRAWEARRATIQRPSATTARATGNFPAKRC